jgi:hypothetical protein
MRDGLAAPVKPTCFECTTVAFTADQVYDVAGDGTTVYVTFGPASTASQELGIVSAAGGAPTTIATADSFVLASFGDAVFYAAATGTSYEVHQRVGGLGGTDTVLGSVTSLALIGVAGNATDVYAVGSETAGTSTLWRWSRAATTPASPTVVSTAPYGSYGSFLLGSTLAAWGAGGVSMAAIPGPSTATTAARNGSAFAFSNDTGFELEAMKLTTHFTQYSIVEFVPEVKAINSFGIINGDVYGLLADANHLYWCTLAGTEASLMTTLSLHVISPDGSGGGAYQWASSVLRQDTTHLYGLENPAPGQWQVDVLAKP